MAVEAGGWRLGEETRKAGNRKRRSAPRPAALSWAEKVIIKELEGRLVAQLSAIATAIQNSSSKGSRRPGAGEAGTSPFT